MDSGWSNAVAAYVGLMIVIGVVICVGIGFLLGWLLT